jgi:hypothetical protein
MSNVAVVGGHGQVARLLHPLLVEAGRTPVALVRSDDQRAELEELGAQVRLLDIERATGPAFADAFAGCDAVVFTAGGGPDGNIERKRTVDLEGSLKSIEGAHAAGITRFVQVSAIGVDEPLPGDTSPVWKAYVEAKRDADEALRVGASPTTRARAWSRSVTTSAGPRSRGPTSPPSWPRSSTTSRPTAGSGTSWVATSRWLTRSRRPRATDRRTLIACPHRCSRP